MPSSASRLRQALGAPRIGLALALVLTLALAVVSLFVGVGSVTPARLWSGEAGGRAWQLLLVSRIPRTLALLLAGASLAIAGLVMQTMIRNRFVEPSTAGTTEAASLGFLTVTLLAPGWPVLAKMGVAALFAFAGTALFLRILRFVPLRDAMLVPLVGLMLGGVIGAVTTFLAYRFGLLPSLLAWTTGDFSAVLSGRYELLWLGLGAAALAYVLADRFTVAGLGRDEITQTLRAALEPQRFVLAAWLGGSAAFDRVDAWSDIDLQVLCEDGRSAEIFARVEAALSSLSPISLVYEVPAPTW